MWVNSPTWYTITTPQSPVLMPTTDSKLTISLGGTQPGSEDAFLRWNESGGIRWLSAKSPKLYGPPYWWNSWGTAEWVACSFPYLHQWEEQPTQCIPGVDHRASPGCTNARQRYTPKVCSDATCNGWAPIDDQGSYIGTWKQKGNTITDTNI